MTTKRDGGLLDEALTRSVIGAFYDVQASPQWGSLRGMSTTSRFAALLDAVLLEPVAQRVAAHAQPLRCLRLVTAGFAERLLDHRFLPLREVGAFGWKYPRNREWRIRLGRARFRLAL